MRRSLGTTGNFVVALTTIDTVVTSITIHRAITFLRLYLVITRLAVDFIVPGCALYFVIAIGGRRFLLRRVNAHTNRLRCRCTTVIRDRDLNGIFTHVTLFGCVVDAALFIELY